jgi:replication factor C subunit 2/4
LEALVYIADGDMRNAINNLQAIYISTGLITKQNVFQICDVPSKEKTEKMFKKLLKGDLDGGIRDFEMLWKENYCLHDLVIYIARTCERMEEVQLDLRMEMMVLASHLKMNEAEGIVSKTQILGFLAKVCQLGIMYYK